MKITDMIEITKTTNGYTLNGKAYLDGNMHDELEFLYRACRGKNAGERVSIVSRAANEGHIESIKSLGLVDTMSVLEVGKSAMQELISFFTEFDFMPNFRFVNTLMKNAYASKEKAKTYVNNYFKLIDSPYANDIREKIKSAEFKSIVEKLCKIPAPKNDVNRRLEIYYGPQGTGKTTQALKDTNNLCIVCNSSMLPADLMEDFSFDDGKATFHPSVLAKCMEEGRPITLDEINLLPFDSLRFLQGILDGKKEINHKGYTVHINEGFKIIGTMNLLVNGVTFGLPEPLVDRCANIVEVELTPEMLLDSILNGDEEF